MSEPEYTESGKIRLDFDDPATLLNRKPKKSILKMKHVSFPAHNSRDLWSRDEYIIFYFRKVPKSEKNTPVLTR